MSLLAYLQNGVPVILAWLLPLAALWAIFAGVLLFQGLGDDVERLLPCAERLKTGFRERQQIISQNYALVFCAALIFMALMLWRQGSYLTLPLLVMLGALLAVGTSSLAASVQERACRAVIIKVLQSDLNGAFQQAFCASAVVSLVSLGLVLLAYGLAFFVSGNIPGVNKLLATACGLSLGALVEAVGAVVRSKPVGEESSINEKLVSGLLTEMSLLVAVLIMLLAATVQLSLGLSTAQLEALSTFPGRIELTEKFRYIMAAIPLAFVVLGLGAALFGIASVTRSRQSPEQGFRQGVLRVLAALIALSLLFYISASFRTVVWLSYLAGLALGSLSFALGAMNWPKLAQRRQLLRVLFLAGLILIANKFGGAYALGMAAIGALSLLLWQFLAMFLYRCVDDSSAYLQQDAEGLSAEQREEQPFTDMRPYARGLEELAAFQWGLSAAALILIFFTLADAESTLATSAAQLISGIFVGLSVLLLDAKRLFAGSVNEFRASAREHSLRSSFFLTLGVLLLVMLFSFVLQLMAVVEFLAGIFLALFFGAYLQGSAVAEQNGEISNTWRWHHALLLFLLATSLLLRAI